jgi:putative chitinase
MFAAPLDAACKAWGIDTPARIGAFLAQVMHESARLTRLEESLWYTTPERILGVFRSKVKTLEAAQRLTRNPQALANTVYADRLGNGDASGGDGWAFRGRGCFQLTGRANYTLAQVQCNRPYVSQPDLVAQPLDACMTAGWYWNARDLNRYADTMQIDEITRAINGPAMLGASERKQFTEEAAKAFA